MNTDLSNKPNKANSFDLKLHSDLERVLLFACDICEVMDGFITLENGSDHEVQVKFGLEHLTDPNEIIGFKQLIDQKEELVISNSNKEEQVEVLNGDYSFDFFAGFPIFNATGALQGTFCLLNKGFIVLSSIQLKIIKEAISQIESLWQLHFENNKLQDFINKTSEQIFDQFDLDGNLTAQSKAQLLRKEAEDFLEKSSNKKYSQVSELDLRSLVHELEVHQIELEMQNEEVTAAQESSERAAQSYRELYDFAPIGYFTLSQEGEILEGNYAIAKMIGKDRDKLINNQFGFFVSENCRSIFNTFLEAIFKSKIKQTCELVLLSNKNTEISILLAGSLSTNLKQCFITAVDISESKNSQLEILKSKQRLTNIMQNVGVGILVQGSNSEILENNSAACDMLGLTRDQLLGTTSFDSLWDIIYRDGSEFKCENYPVIQAIKYLKPVRNIVMGVHRPLRNYVIWLLVDAIPILGDNEELLYVVCSFTDITTLKNAEDALEVSINRFYLASLATSAIIWDWQISTQKVFVSNSYYVQFGYHFNDNFIDLEEFNNLVHKDDKEFCLQSLKDCLDGKGSRWSAEYRYLKTNGEYAYVKDNAIIIRDLEGKALQMIGAMHDITLEVKLKEKLEQSEEKFKGAFEHSAVGIALVDTHGYWQVVNNTLSTILGYTEEEFRAMTVYEITHPDDLEEYLFNKEKLSAGNSSSFNMEKRYYHKNKSVVWAQLFVSVVKDAKGEIVNYIPQIIDITERKRVEDENKWLTDEISKNKTIQLNEATGFYRLLADNTIDLVCLHHMNSKFTYVSPSIERILGFVPEELLELSPLQFVHPKDLDKLQRMILSFMTVKQVKNITLRLKHKKGFYIWCESKVTLVIENGIPINFQTATRDITQEREAKVAIKKAINKEKELNKLRINLVSTISHELRTPMSTIVANADLIEMYIRNKKLDNVSFIDERINVIRGEIDRVVSLMDSLLVLSKNDMQKTSYDAVTFDLKEFCLKIISEGNYSKTKKRNIKATFQEATFPVHTDMKLMEYILINLLKNACKYSQGNDDVILGVFNKEDIIVVEIIDTGIGIPEDEQVNLFNIFFRASNTNGIEGTGLGLYIVKIFTEINLGDIKIESKLGKGTKVTLQFPRAK
ncbi:PAS domain S-box protein [Flavobacterium sp. ACAM 123]|uniref:PAS domain-containing protein n=1 Tax=Flavobacterium sp. ACAM 123 TaxID=1189620 RepID=UPI000314B1A1|nr:PAS domain S-box protein [Flavobacterium sp. ACAM 123]